MAGIRSWLATAVLLLGACGGGSGTGGGVPTLPGAGGVGGGAGGSSGSGCNVPCLNTLVSVLERCQPSGTCTQQMVGTTAANACYSNGVKVQVSVGSLTTDAISMTMSVKKGAVCYSMIMNESEAGDMTLIFKDASGAAIATIGTGASGEDTITCPGGSPSALSSECDTQAGSVGTLASPPTSECVDGTCSY
jgi:hypothetical protein